MKKSKRSNVDPFIVMDVMESARKAEQSGKKIIHMEVGPVSYTHLTLPTILLV